jgi:hypothetical protein
MYAYGTMGEELCSVAADAADEKIIKNKTRAVEAKTIGYNCSLYFIYSSFFTFYFINFNLYNQILSLIFKFSQICILQKLFNRSELSRDRRRIEINPAWKCLGFPLQKP